MIATIRIEVVYALPAQQVVRELTLETGATARTAVLASRLADDFTGIALGGSPLACFGRMIDWDTVLGDGDRVEILRPLLADPKEARRRRAGAQTTDIAAKKPRKT